MSKEEVIEGCKGFDQDLKCKEFQYEIGKEYEHEGEVKCCISGFHFCENPLDVLSYYPPAYSRYCRVEGTGRIDRDDEDSKIACSKLKIKEEISLTELVEAGIKLILEKADWKSIATNIGLQSVATNTGNRGAATNVGYQSVATNTGNWSVATNTGNCSTATNTGDCSAAINAGDYSTTTSVGLYGVAANTGYQSAATNTGYKSAAINTGDRSAATNTGNRSATIVEGQESAAIAIGYQSKAKGALGCWLMLAEWDNEGKHIIDMQCQRVDGENIKANTWYKLIGGKFREQDIIKNQIDGGEKRV